MLGMLTLGILTWVCAGGFPKDFGRTGRVRQQIFTVEDTAKTPLCRGGEAKVRKFEPEGGVY